jgi:hypothetical protein
MKTLQDDIDDLDRMVDTGAQKDATRSQIRLITREVAALQADYANLAEEHTRLQATSEQFDKRFAEMKAEFERKLLEMKARDKQELSSWLAQKAKEQAEFRKRHTLHYDA